MASLLAVQRLFSAQNFFFVVPTTIAYGESRNAKKNGVGLFILELFSKKTKKMAKNGIFSLIFLFRKLSISQD
jgi:hypothetical protein